MFWLLIPAAVAAIALDVHSHRCDTCGRRWTHAGLFAGGCEHDPAALRAHTCVCGARKWDRER